MLKALKYILAQGYTISIDSWCNGHIILVKDGEEGDFSNPDEGLEEAIHMAYRWVAGKS